MEVGIWRLFIVEQRQKDRAAIEIMPPAADAPPGRAEQPGVESGRRLQIGDRHDHPEDARNVCGHRGGIIAALARAHPLHHTPSHERGKRYPTQRARLHAARAAPPQLPALLRRPDRLAGRHLDDADRDQLAGLPADRLGAPARAGRLRRADPLVPPRPLRRRARRPLGPPPRCWSSPRSWRCSSRRRWRRSTLAGVINIWHVLALEPLPGADQRLRHAGAAGLRGRDGREPGGPAATPSPSTPRWSTPPACWGRRSAASSSPPSARGGASRSTP